MKVITGQLKPSKGSITVLGEPIWGNPALYFRIGFCPEQDAFYERMTGLEWVAALVRLNGSSESESLAIARRALEIVELTDAAERRFGAYSKGHAQRVKMRRRWPTTGPADSWTRPLAAWIPIMRRKTLRLIKDWGRAGKSILVRAIFLHEIRVDDGRIILLINQGRILAEATSINPRSDRRASAHRLHQGRSDARARPRVPDPRRCAESEIRR